LAALGSVDNNTAMVAFEFLSRQAMWRGRLPPESFIMSDWGNAAIKALIASDGALFSHAY
jgi:hypothetical protein